MDEDEEEDFISKENRKQKFDEETVLGKIFEKLT